MKSLLCHCMNQLYRGGGRDNMGTLGVISPQWFSPPTWLLNVFSCLGEERKELIENYKGEIKGMIMRLQDYTLIKVAQYVYIPLFTLFKHFLAAHLLKSLGISMEWLKDHFTNSKLYLHLFKLGNNNNINNSNILIIVVTRAQLQNMWFFQQHHWFLDELQAVQPVYQSRPLGIRGVCSKSAACFYRNLITKDDMDKDTSSLCICQNM